MSDAAVRAMSPTSAAPTQAKRNRPLLRSTGSHAQAERQMRSVASPVVATRSGSPMRAHSLTSGLPSGAPSSSALIAHRLAIESWHARFPAFVVHHVGSVPRGDVAPPRRGPR